MKAVYEATIKVTVVHDVDGFDNLKDSNEFATDICNIICDEASVCNAVACYEVLESSIDVK